jgi:hypothetical protein
MAAGSLPKTWRSPQDVVMDRLRPASEGGIITLSANGKKIGEGRVEMTTPFKYALAEGQDIGEDSGSPDRLPPNATVQLHQPSLVE